MTIFHCIPEQLANENARDNSSDNTQHGLNFEYFSVFQFIFDDFLYQNVF